MFYEEEQAVMAINEDPLLIFKAIKEGYREVIINTLPVIDLNICDNEGNNVLMKLLKYKYYDLVLKYMNLETIDINHQNNDGDTFAHILAMINYVEVKDIINALIENKNFLPNIKNNLGETILDKSINNNYLYTTAKILSDKRFDNINLNSFKCMYEAYIKNNEYGKYSKLNNFTLIMDKLSDKTLLPTMNKLIKLINKNEDVIKNDFFMSKTNNLENIINYLIKETI